MKSPTLLILGDSDLVRPEHAVEMFRLLGGGIFGDLPAGLPAPQLAVLPGTTHVTLVKRSVQLIPIITSSLRLIGSPPASSRRAVATLELLGCRRGDVDLQNRFSALATGVGVS